MTAAMWCSTSEETLAFVFRFKMSNLIEAAIWNIPTYCPTPTSKCTHTHTRHAFVITHSPRYDPWSTPAVPLTACRRSRGVVGLCDPPHTVNVISTCAESWMDFWLAVQANSMLLSEGTSLFSHCNSGTHQSLMTHRAVLRVQQLYNNREQGWNSTFVPCYPEHDVRLMSSSSCSLTS